MPLNVDALYEALTDAKNSLYEAREKKAPSLKLQELERKVLEVQRKITTVERGDSDLGSRLDVALAKCVKAESGMREDAKKHRKVGDFGAYDLWENSKGEFEVYSSTSKVATYSTETRALEWIKKHNDSNGNN